MIDALIFYDKKILIVVVKKRERNRTNFSLFLASPTFYGFEIVKNKINGLIDLLKRREAKRC